MQCAILIKIQTHTVSLKFINPASARPISQIHNWLSITPEFICMVPVEVFTRCLWVSLTWLGCRSANLLGRSSGCLFIIGWLQEKLVNLTRKSDVCDKDSTSVMSFALYCPCGVWKFLSCHPSRCNNITMMNLRIFIMVCEVLSLIWWLRHSSTRIQLFLLGPCLVSTSLHKIHPQNRNFSICSRAHFSL